MINSLRPETALKGGRYRIISTLGRGGFGITYLATDTHTGARVAIKEFFFAEYSERDSSTSAVRLSTKSQAELVERFRVKFNKEALLISSLSHPNIVRIFDLFDENGTSYYVMEYIEGQSLQALVDQVGRLIPEDCIYIVDEISKALSYIHSRSINHLDIKPANVLLEKGSDRIVLIDFGVSKQYDPSTGTGTTSTPVGISNGYSPLEQYNDGGVQQFSPRSDIYSLGATLYTLLTGTVPPSAIDLLQNGLSVPADIPPTMRNAILVSMDPMRDNRPATALQFFDIVTGKCSPTVGAAAGGGGGGGVATTVQLPAKSNRWKWAGGAIAAAIVGLIVLVAIVAISIPVVSSLMKGEAEEIAYATDTTDYVIPAPEGAPEAPKITTQTISAQAGESYSRIDYPVDGPDILVNSIREWILQQEAPNYSGDKGNVSALSSEVQRNLSESYSEEGLGYSKTAIKIGYQDDLIITYVCDNDWWSGGAGGGSVFQGQTGATFRKSDGRQLQMDDINWGSISSYAVDGLMKYFDVSSRSDLEEQLNEGLSLSYLPIPNFDPYIMNGKVYFRYSTYEISYGSAGSPHFTIPASVVKDAMNQAGRSYLP